MNNKLAKKITGIALVTGAGGGIGRALCEQLANSNVRVYGCDINKKAVSECNTSLQEYHPENHCIYLDITNRDAFIERVDKIENELGPIDLLVNNAGIGVGGEWLDHQPDDWRSIFDVNVFGMVNGVDAVYPRMQTRGRGAIINVASVAGKFPLPGEAAYVASKYAAVGMTRVLQIEAQAHGVEVMLVCPGKIDTAIYETAPVRGFDKDAIIAMYPKGIGPQECAEKILVGFIQNKSEIIITPFAKTLSTVEKHAPQLVTLFGDLYMRQMRKHRVD